MPMPSAFDRSTGEWTPVDSGAAAAGVLPGVARGRSFGLQQVPGAFGLGAEVVLVVAVGREGVRHAFDDES